MMDMSNEEMIWEDFILKVGALVTYGYNMPYDNQLRAVYELDQQLIKWKQRLVVNSDGICGDDDDDNSGDNIDHDDVMPILSVKLKLESNDSSFSDVICGDDDDNSGGNIDHGDVNMPILPVKLKLESNDSSFSDVICGDDDDNAGGDIDHDDVLPVKLESHDSSDTCMFSKMSKKNGKRKRPFQAHTPRKSTICGNKDDKISDEDTLKDNSCETKHSMGNKHSQKRSNRIDVQLESSYPNEKIDVKQEDHNIGKGDVSSNQLDSVDQVNDGSDKANYCDVCDKTYSLKGNFRYHMLIHKYGPLKCNDCDKTFKSVAGLSLHKQMHNPTEACPHCEHKAPNQSTLKRHINRVHFRGDSSRKPHLCDHCGNRFYTADALNSHVITHVRDKQYKCSHCDHATHTEILLAKHIKNMHVDQDPFICNICGATTKFKDSMDAHQRRHYDERPFKCTECSHTSISASDMARHKMIHKERAFQCGVCQKKFVYKRQLNRHIVIHTGEKNFACLHCTFKCNVSANLNKHMLNIHNIKKHNEIKIKRVNDISITTEPHTEAIHSGAVQQQLSEQHTAPIHITDMQAQ